MSEQALITWIEQQGYQVETYGVYRESRVFQITKDGSPCLFFTLPRFGTPKELEETINWVRYHLEEKFFPTKQE